MSVRKITISMLISILLLVSCSSLPSAPTSTPTATLPPTPIAVSDPTFLAGLWKGTYSDSEVVMTFDLKGNVSIAAYGNLQAGTYSLDIEKTPYQLDMDLVDYGIITTIIEFVDSNNIKIENVYPFDPRPSTFYDFFLLTRSE